MQLIVTIALLWGRSFTFLTIQKIIPETMIRSQGLI